MEARTHGSLSVGLRNQGCSPGKGETGWSWVVESAAWGPGDAKAGNVQWLVGWRGAGEHERFQGERTARWGEALKLGRQVGKPGVG